MNPNTLVDVCKILKNCFDSAEFKPIIDLLAEDVVRTSMWYEDIVGKEAMIEYFRSKIQILDGNLNYRASLATLEYLNGLPASMAETRAIAKQGTHEGSVKIKEGSKIILWYPEGKPVVVLKGLEHSTVKPVLIDLVLNDEGLISKYNLVDSQLYNYKEVIDPNEYTYDELQELGMAEVERYFTAQCYKVKTLPYQKGYYPHMILEDRVLPQSVTVFTDHYPFVGRAINDVYDFIQNEDEKLSRATLFVFAQVTSLALPKHIIRKDQPYAFRIEEIFTYTELMEYLEQS